MGLFGGDSKSTTNQTDSSQQVGFSDLGNGVATAIRGDGNSVQLLDGGAISEAFDFAQDLSETSAANVTESIKAVTESARTETENIFINLQKYALYGGIVFGAVFIVRAFKT